MSGQEISAAVQEVQAVGDEILDTVKTVDPIAEVPLEVGETVLNLLSKMVSSALTAYANASGTPITVDTLQALLPNATPLTAPDPAAA